MNILVCFEIFFLFQQRTYSLSYECYEESGEVTEVTGEVTEPREGRDDLKDVSFDLICFW